MVWELKVTLLRNIKSDRMTFIEQKFTLKKVTESPNFIETEMIGLMSRVFAFGLGDQGSILGQVIPKTQKMVLDATLLNTQHYKVSIKGKVEQSREGVAPYSTP